MEIKKKTKEKQKKMKEKGKETDEKIEIKKRMENNEKQKNR